MPRPGPTVVFRGASFNLPVTGEPCDNPGVARTRELEIRLEHTEQQLHLLQQISRFMVRDMPLGDALQKAVLLVVEFMNSDSCLLYLLDGQELVLVATHQPKTDSIGKVRLKMTEGLTGWVARERRLLSISREAYRDPRFKLFTDLPEDTYEAFLSSPVIVRGRVAGVINVQHRDPHFHSGGEMELLTTVGEQLGCLVALATADLKALDTAQVVDLVTAAPARR
ncbi:MAG: GAF domain-containing protein [Acidobacteriota bacterium]